MGRLAIVLRMYSEIEPRPFSRFSSIEIERELNDKWNSRAVKWGEVNVDNRGNCYSNLEVLGDIDNCCVFC